MIAALYSMTLTRVLPERKVSVKEFIIYGNHEKNFNECAEAIRIRFETEECTAQLDGPFYIDNTIYGENGRDNIDWDKLSLEVEDKSKRKPKGVGGCIFRGMWNDESKEDWDAYRYDLKDSIEHFMPEHRSNYYGEEFYFVSAIQNDKTNKLTGKAIIIKANNLEHAADISQLFFFDQGPVTVFTTWCCPIRSCIRSQNA